MAGGSLTLPAADRATHSSLLRYGRCTPDGSQPGGPTRETALPQGRRTPCLGTREGEQKRGKSLPLLYLFFPRMLTHTHTQTPKTKYLFGSKGRIGQ